MHLRPSLNRRDFVKLAGGAAAGFALSAALPHSAFAQSAKRADELNILCWEGYNSDNVLNPFRKLHKGLSLKAESGTDDPSMINKLRAGEIKIWDLINLNQCWARQQMWGEGLIKPLNKERFLPYIEKMMPMFYNKEMGINPFSLSPDGQLIGMMQRFGPMNFVINTKKISINTAEDEGLPLFLDPAMKGRYGLLAWDNWNVLHMCVASGFTPYKVHTPEEVETFGRTARTLFANAKMISGDPAQLNQALINGEIDAIFSGGTYTCSVARKEGFNEVYHISPRKGPLAGGKGSLQWFEVTSVVNNPDVSPLAEDFLEYVQRPDICHTVAMADASHNPVTQMSQPEVFSKFSKEELNCFQWETLEEDMSRSADYETIPDNDLLTSIYNEAKRTREA